jgi:hypothetical protein
MLRTTTIIVISISVILMMMAFGCSESEDTILSPRDRDDSVPCGYEPGVVVVQFDGDASLVDIDIVVRSFGLGYRYMSMGQFWVVADVVQGEAVEIQERISASPLVENVVLAHRSYPDRASFLVMQFAVGVALEDALAFVRSYAELAITRSRRDPVMVFFEVVVGHEDDWISHFLDEELVIWSGKSWVACPAAR